MDTTRRTIAKAFSWQLVGLVTMMTLGTIFTGSAGIGGVLALTSAAFGTVCYIMHEKLWALVAWGQIAKRAGPRPSAPMQ